MFASWVNQYSCPFVWFVKTKSYLSAAGAPGFEPKTFGSMVGHSTTRSTFLHKHMCFLFCVTCFKWFEWLGLRLSMTYPSQLLSCEKAILLACLEG